MIRRNESLNCACAGSGSDCPNGNRINSITGEHFCEKIEKVEPINFEKLDKAIEVVNLMYAVSEPASKAIKGTSRTDRTLGLFDAGMDPHVKLAGKYGDNKNHPNTIKENLIASDCIRIASLSHRIKRTRKPISVVPLSDAYLAGIDKLISMRGEYFPILPFYDETIPTNPTRDLNYPLWVKK